MSNFVERRKICDMKTLIAPGNVSLLFDSPYLRLHYLPAWPAMFTSGLNLPTRPAYYENNVLEDINGRASSSR